MKNNFRPGLYDLILIDIVLPKMDGFELYKKIRKLDNKENMLFISRRSKNKMPTIVHFEIPADDVERSKKFYGDLFICLYQLPISKILKEIVWCEKHRNLVTRVY